MSPSHHVCVYQRAMTLPDAVGMVTRSSTEITIETPGDAKYRGRHVQRVTLCRYSSSTPYWKLRFLHGWRVLSPPRYITDREGFSGELLKTIPVPTPEQREPVEYVRDSERIDDSEMLADAQRQSHLMDAVSRATNTQYPMFPGYLYDVGRVQAAYESELGSDVWVDRPF